MEHSATSKVSFILNITYNSNKNLKNVKLIFFSCSTKSDFWNIDFAIGTSTFKFLSRKGIKFEEKTGWLQILTFFLHFVNFGVQ